MYAVLFVVIFLCTFDPFGFGEAKYEFENRCIKDPELDLQDGTTKLFFNCTCPLEKVPAELKDLYRYIQTQEAGTDLTERIAKAVEKVKRNEKWRSEYMKELLYYDDIRTDAIAEGQAIGRAEGRAEGRAYSVLELLSELGDVTEELRTRIMGEQDSDKLSIWLKLAARVESIEEFLEKAE